MPCGGFGVNGVCLPLAGAPVPLNTTLGFCAYSGSRCCDAAADAALKKQFEAMNVSDAACAAVLKSVLCAVRIPSYLLADSIQIQWLKSKEYCCNEE